MTVIAWDGHVLAADRQFSYGDSRMEAGKITMHICLDERKYLIATCGSAAESVRLAKALVHCLDTGDCDKYISEKFEGGSVVMVKIDSDRSECTVFEERITGFKVKAPMARGCGTPYALTAMHLGKSAVQAVLVTNKLCDGCGFGVDAYDCVTGKYVGGE